MQGGKFSKMTYLNVEVLIRPVISQEIFYNYYIKLMKEVSQNFINMEVLIKHVVWKIFSKRIST